MRFMILGVALLVSISGQTLAASFQGDQPTMDGPRLPFSFVENQGQWPDDVQFQVRAQGMLVRIQEDGIVLRLRSGTQDGPQYSLVKMSFGGGGDGSNAIGEREQTGRYHFLLGSDRESWRTEVRGFDSVVYRDLYPGIDLRLREQDGLLEYDILLTPGASLEPMSLRVEGIDELSLDEVGALVMKTEAGTLHQKLPKTWQVGADGATTPVECRYRILGEHQFGFVIPCRDPTLSTVIDPSLEWSTFFGGSGTNDRLYSVVVDDQGLVTVGGQTNTASGFWTQDAFDSSYNGGYSDAFLAQFDPSQSGAAQLLWCTYLGGELSDGTNRVRVSPDGTVTALGFTDSTQFPTMNPYQPAFAGGVDDRWLAQLDPAQVGANQLLWSTYLGGDGDEDGAGLHVAAAGIVTASGTTDSTNFPTTSGSYSTGPIGGRDAWVARLDPSQAPADQLLYGTYVGGSLYDQPNGMEVDAAGVVTLAGWTASAGTFPLVAGSYDISYNGGTHDGFLLRLDPSLAAANQVVYGTYLGGSDEDGINGLGVDANGVFTVTGSVKSSDFPTTSGAFDTSFNGPNGSYDAFVTQISPDLLGANDLRYSTFLGGRDDLDYGYQLVVDSTGGVTVSGYTYSDDFPTTAYAWDRKLDFYDVFVSRLSMNSQGKRDLVCSTYLGGTGTDVPWEVTVDSHNLPIVVGRTGSGDYPITTGAFQNTKGVSLDGFLTKLKMVSWSNYGTGWPGTSGQVPALTSSHYPVLGRPLTIDAENSWGVNTIGFLFVGFDPASVPVKRGGTILVDPYLTLMFPVPAAGLSLPWTILNDPTLCDLDIYLQLLQSDPGAVGKISMTEGLHLILGG